MYFRNHPNSEWALPRPNESDKECVTGRLSTRRRPGKQDRHWACSVRSEQKITKNSPTNHKGGDNSISTARLTDRNYHKKKHGETTDDGQPQWSGVANVAILSRRRAEVARKSLNTPHVARFSGNYRDPGANPQRGGERRHYARAGWTPRPLNTRQSRRWRSSPWWSPRTSLWKRGGGRLVTSRRPPQIWHDRWSTRHSGGHVKSCAGSRVVLDSFFRADSILTHMTIQVTDSTQITNLLTLLNSDSTQNPNLLTWLTTHHILPNLGKSCWRGGGCGRT